MYVCICVCVCVYKEIYYKELAHVNMEADKSQDLQSWETNWGPRRADGVGLI